jgi:hypothetical protein
MNSKKARQLRKLSKFEPNEKRKYIGRYEGKKDNSGFTIKAV